MTKVLFIEGVERVEFQQRVKKDPRFQGSTFGVPATYVFLMKNILFSQDPNWGIDALAIDIDFLNGIYPRYELPNLEPIYDIPKPVSFYKAQRPEISKLPVVGLTSLEGEIMTPDGVDTVYSVHQHTILDILRRYIASREKRT